MPEQLKAEAAFLCERLREFGWTVDASDTETIYRDYYGHVVPSLARLEAALEALTTRSQPGEDAVEDFLHELDGWESAYPLSAFPEPDLAKAAELLKAGGMTLDAVSASNMRHVVSQIAPKARAAIAAMRALEPRAASDDGDVGCAACEDRPEPGENDPCAACGRQSQPSSNEARLREALENALDLIDELYRKYGVELDDVDVATAQASRNAALSNEGNR